MRRVFLTCLIVVAQGFAKTVEVQVNVRTSGAQATELADALEKLVADRFGESF